MQYILPDGTTGEPRSFTHNGYHYGPDTFDNHTREELLSKFGIMEFSEDAVPQFYTPGEPVDVELDGRITRTYPNAALDEEAQAAGVKAGLLAQIADLESLQTPRLLREALKKKSCTVNKPGTIIHGLSPKDAVDTLDEAIDALRAQIVGGVHYQVE
jgi:hypothetical protein